ncbi:hypothetical protein [Rubritalea marina]|uniref:hypothetical protein n=1 Tax=Rubritalea marina TaxID=361055 RepID=UPI00037F1911|nr:hypothetical protein [Rubritalea marina]
MLELGVTELLASIVKCHRFNTMVGSASVLRDGGLVLRFCGGGGVRLGAQQYDRLALEGAG